MEYILYIETRLTSQIYDNLDSYLFEKGLQGIFKFVLRFNCVSPIVRASEGRLLWLEITYAVIESYFLYIFE